MENSENTTPAKPFYDGLLSVIVPCKNEVEAIPVFYGEFKKVMQGMGSPKYELIFVEDGSTDGTLDLLRRMSKEDPSVRFISFSRNFGKEAAMYAGLKSARGDYVTIMDVDLQDPPSLLPDMFSAIISEGYDSVASRRCTRCGDCLKVCPEPQVINFKQAAACGIIASGECTSCGKCAAVCAENAIVFAPRFNARKLARTSQNCEQESTL